jgi:hypothetical protein
VSLQHRSHALGCYTNTICPQVASLFTEEDPEAKSADGCVGLVKPLFGFLFLAALVDEDDRWKKCVEDEGVMYAGCEL